MTRPHPSRRDGWPTRWRLLWGWWRSEPKPITPPDMVTVRLGVLSDEMKAAGWQSNEIAVRMERQMLLPSFPRPMPPFPRPDGPAAEYNRDAFEFEQWMGEQEHGPEDFR